MNSPESKNQLAVFDSLLDSLAHQAQDLTVTPRQFFDKTIQVVEAVLSPQWVAILANANQVGWLKVAGDCPAEVIGELLENRDPAVISTEIENRATEIANWGWLLISLSSNASTIEQEVAQGLSEIVSQFVTRRSRTDGVSSSWSEHLFRFTVNAHRSLEPDQLGIHLTNDARLLMGCERVSLFSLNRRKPQLLAISSVAQVEKRSELVSNMKAIAWQGKQKNEIFSAEQVSREDSGDTRLKRLLTKHIESTGLPFVVGIPILSVESMGTKATPKRKLIGFMLVESTEEVDRFQFSRGLSHVVPHAAVALANAQTHSSIPFRKSLGALGWLLKWANLSKTMIAFGLVGAAIIAANVIQTEFKIRVQGELRPVVERNVFAPLDATVDAVHVNHGDEVKENQVLAQLRSAELEIEIEKTKKQLENLTQLKDAKEITLNQVSNLNADPSLAAQLASEVTDIEFQIESAKKTQKYLAEKQARLRIVCPINGIVTTWQAKENLVNKPVRWGDPILNVADLEGEWEVLFEVPEKRIGYILDRQKALENSENPSEVDGTKVSLEMFLESSPGNKYTISIDEIDRSATRDEKVGAVTRMTCPAPSGLVSKRQGATVAADVYCGQRSLWFVWTRELRDSLKRRFVW